MISYEGIDEAELILGLYHETRALGYGILHDRNALSIEDVRSEVSEMLKRDPDRIYIDYYHGRPLKLKSLDVKAKQFDERLYDRDAGSGAAQRVVDRLRRAS